MEGYEHGTISPLTSIDYGAYLAGDTQSGVLEGRMHDVLRRRGFHNIHDLVIQLDPKPSSPILPVIVVTAAASAPLDRVRRRDLDECYSSVLYMHRAPTGPKLLQGRSTRAIGTPIGITQLAITAKALSQHPQGYVGGLKEIKDSITLNVDVDLGGIGRPAPPVTEPAVAEPDTQGDHDKMQRLRICARFEKREGPATYLGHLEFDLTQLLFKIEKDTGMGYEHRVGAAGGPPQNMSLGLLTMEKDSSVRRLFNT